MKKSGLRLKKYFYPEVSLVSFHKGEELPELPELTIDAFVHSQTSMHVSVKVVWGEEEKSKYAIRVLVYGDVEMPSPGPADEKKIDEFLQRNVPMLTVTTAQLLLGAARERIHSLTESAPYGARTLPVLILDEEDPQIYLSEEMRKLMGVETETRPAPRKKHSKKKAK